MVHVQVLSINASTLITLFLFLHRPFSIYYFFYHLCNLFIPLYSAVVLYSSFSLQQNNSFMININSKHVSHNLYIYVCVYIYIYIVGGKQNFLHKSNSDIVCLFTYYFLRSIKLKGVFETMDKAKKSRNYLWPLIANKTEITIIHV